MHKFVDFKCPYCFKTLQYNNVVFRKKEKDVHDYYLEQFERDFKGNESANKVGYGYVDPALLDKKLLNPDKSTGYLTSVKVQDDNGRTLVLKERLCPYCHNTLPEKLGKNPVKYIAVIGAPQSGKTTFLAAVNYRMRRYNCCVWLGYYDIINTYVKTITEKTFGDPDEQEDEESQPDSCGDDVLQLTAASEGGIEKQETFREVSSDQSAETAVGELNDQSEAHPGEKKSGTKDPVGPFFYGIKSNDLPVQTDIVFYDIPGEYCDRNEDLEKNASIQSYLDNADGIVFVIDIAYENIDTMINQAQAVVDNLFKHNLTKPNNIAVLFNKFDRVETELTRGIDGFVGTEYFSAIQNSTEPLLVDMDEINKRSCRVRENILKENGKGFAGERQEAMQICLGQIENTFSTHENKAVNKSKIKVFITRFLEESQHMRFPECAEAPFLWLLAECGVLPAKDSIKRRRFL